VFEDRMQRRIFGTKREDMEGGWRRLHNEELYNLFASLRVIKSSRMRWAGHVVRMGEMRSAYSVLVGKPERKRPLGRPNHKWEDNIKMDLREIRWEGVDWMHLAHAMDQWQAVVNTIMNLRVA
jgi:hypothetical protein